MSDKIKKLVNTLIILSNSSDVMMTSFIGKEGSGAIRHLGSAILNLLSVIHFTWKNINWGDRYKKIDLCIKWCLDMAKKSLVMKFREKLSLFRDLTTAVPFTINWFSWYNPLAGLWQQKAKSGLLQWLTKTVEQWT